MSSRAKGQAGAAVVLVAGLLLLAGGNVFGQSQSCVKLPPWDPHNGYVYWMSAIVNEYESCDTVRSFPAELSMELYNVPSGYAIWSTTYQGFCADLTGTILDFRYFADRRAPYQVRPWLSTDPELPAELITFESVAQPGTTYHIPWDKVNYVMSRYRDENWLELQAAIWSLVHGCGLYDQESGGKFVCPPEREAPFFFPYGNTNPEPPWGCDNAPDIDRVKAIVADANENGGGFVPGRGDRVSVVLQIVSCAGSGYCDQRFQIVFFPIENIFCELEVSKTCCVPAPPSSGAFNCSDAKPIDSLTMEYAGGSGMPSVINVRAWKGSVGGTLLATINNISIGQRITVAGMGGSPNDQVWEIFNSSGQRLGVSEFHISCSDPDMNGPEDCGTLQGNGKDNASGLNIWKLRGIGGKISFTCPGNGSGAQTETMCAPPTPGAFSCSDAKPIDSLTMRYVGTDGAFALPYTVRVRAWKGSVGSTLLREFVISQGDVVKVTGMGGSPNDQIWEIYDLNGPKLGESKFHISCSDSDMNGPEDCGKAQGNAKTTGFSTSLLNVWQLAGIGGRVSFTCQPENGSLFSEECRIEPPPPPHCTSKVRALTFRYLGGDCTISNTQSGKAKCSGGTLSGAASLVMTKDASKFVVTPNSGIQVGDMVTIKMVSGGDFPADVQFSATDSAGRQQTYALHTSCSQPLNLGDRFGAFTVFGLNMSSGGEITYGGGTIEYQYTVKNPNDYPVTVSRVMDDMLGEVAIPAGRETIPAGQSVTFFKTAEIEQTTVNTATVEYQKNGGDCGTCFAKATVIVDVPGSSNPPGGAFSCSQAQPINSLTMEFIGPGYYAGVNVPAVIDVIAWRGGPNTVKLAEFKGVTAGQKITVQGLGGTPCAQMWQIINSQTGQTIGYSEFDISCSDEEMNGIEDCGSLQGNGKCNGCGLLNIWILRGMSGNQTMSCPQ